MTAPISSNSNYYASWYFDLKGNFDHWDSSCIGEKIKTVGKVTALIASYFTIFIPLGILLWEVYNFDKDHIPSIRNRCTADKSTATSAGAGLWDGFYKENDIDCFSEEARQWLQNGDIFDESFLTDHKEIAGSTSDIGDSIANNDALDFEPLKDDLFPLDEEIGIEEWSDTTRTALEKNIMDYWPKTEDRLSLYSTDSV